MNFHKKYKRITPWWRVISQEFKLLEQHSRQTLIFNKPYEDEQVKLHKNGLLTIKPGFLWGASFLTIDTPSSREASCVHDGLFYLSDKGLFKGKDSEGIRKISDDLLYKICIENGMYSWRAKTWHTVLRKFSGIAWESD